MPVQTKYQCTLLTKKGEPPDPEEKLPPKILKQLTTIVGYRDGVKSDAKACVTGICAVPRLKSETVC